MFVNRLYTLSTFGFSFTPAKNSTTTHDKLMTKKYSLNTGLMFCRDTFFGDYINAQVIDIDNVLGAGNNFILSQYLNEWQVWDGTTELSNYTIGDFPAAGLYLRIIYTSVGTIVDPKVSINLISYEKEE